MPDPCFGERGQTEGRTSYTYYAGAKRIPEGVAPDMKNKSWSLTAEVDIPEGGAKGMVAALGGLFDGWALYFIDGKPVFHNNFGNVQHYQIAVPDAIPAGKHTVLFDFLYDGGGIGKGGTAMLSVDGVQKAQGRIEATVGVRFTMSVETFDVGEDTGTPVNMDYDVPFRFTGSIGKVIIDLKPQSPELAAQHHLAGEHAAHLRALRE